MSREAQNRQQLISALTACELLQEWTNETSGGFQASMTANGLREFMEANQYEHVVVRNDCYRLRFNGENGDYNMFAEATEEPAQIRVFTYCPVKVPEDRRRLVADYLNRVNYGLVVGCLEMDPNDGEVRSRSTAPIAPGEPGPSVLRPLFDSSFYLIDNWLPGLLRVAFGAEDPATAYATTLAALRGDHTPVECADGGEADSEPEPELTAIEQEVSRLLAERHSDPDPPPPCA
jgi:hypothetical protein